MAERNYKINFQSKTYQYSSLLFQSLSQQIFDNTGVDFLYIPKNTFDPTKVDLVFQEIQSKTYTKLFRIRGRIDSTSLYSDGESAVFSQFGLTLNDQIKIYFTQKEFYEITVDDAVEVDISKGRHEFETLQTPIDYSSVQPTIDDLIYVDQFGGKLFKITSVSEYNTAHSKFNQPVIWQIVCDMWEASSNDKIAVVPETTASDDTKEFADIINNIDANIKSTDLTDSDVQEANETGKDVGSGVYGQDNLNDNYRKESTNTVRNTDKTNPFSEF